MQWEQEIRNRIINKAANSKKQLDLKLIIKKLFWTSHLIRLLETNAMGTRNLKSDHKRSRKQQKTIRPRNNDQKVVLDDSFDSSFRDKCNEPKKFES